MYDLSLKRQHSLCRRAMEEDIYARVVVVLLLFVVVVMRKLLIILFLRLFLRLL